MQTETTPAPAAPVSVDHPLRAAGAILVNEFWKRVGDLIITGVESGSYATFGLAGKDKPSSGEFPRLNDADHAKVMGETPEVGYYDYPLNGGVLWLLNKYDEDANPKEHDAKPAPWVRSEFMKDKKRGDYWRYALDMAALENGMAVFLKDASRHFGDWMKEGDDAITGDVFLQCCIFGDIIYG